MWQLSVLKARGFPVAASFVRRQISLIPVLRLSTPCLAANAHPSDQKPLFASVIALLGTLQTNYKEIR